MDFQFWIYVIIAVIYVLTRLGKKKEAQHTDMADHRPEQRTRHENTAEKPKQLTFEELLREITEAKQPEKPVYQSPKPVYQPPTQREEVVDYDDNLGEEAQDLEEVDYDYKKKDKLYNIYEEAKRTAFEKPSLEETMNIRDTVVKFGKFKVFEQDAQRNLLDEYTRDFQDPEGLKKAVVMSEILNRKF